MVIFNTSYILSPDLEKDFCDWMKSVYLKLVDDIDIVENKYLCKLMLKREDEYLTYSLQMFFESVSQHERFINEYYKNLFSVFNTKFGNNIYTFTSLMEEVK
ncbi:MAG: DUF4286 family protein [Marinifilaceae bacterium]|jgi:hypothetical protein|nr:DUF4286 family protein [Marinifilaceae bacterium]